MDDAKLLAQGKEEITAFAHRLLELLLYCYNIVPHTRLASFFRENEVTMREIQNATSISQLLGLSDVLLARCDSVLTLLPTYHG